jgi:hypothetical protein
MSSYSYDQGDSPTTEETVNALGAEVLSMRLEKWQQLAAQKFPGVAAIADHLTGTSEEQVMELARSLHEQMTGGGGAAPSSTPESEAASTVDQEREALRRNPGGDWSAYLAAKYREAGVA